jgi:hypothetical protein
VNVILWRLSRQQVGMFGQEFQGATFVEERPDIVLACPDTWGIKLQNPNRVWTRRGGVRTQPTGNFDFLFKDMF